jgi:hypothetical protein
MEGLDQQLPFALFEVDVTDRPEGDPSTGIEGVDHAIGGIAALELILEHPEHLCGNVVEFELRVIAQPAFAMNVFDVLAPKIQFEQFPLEW